MREIGIGEELLDVLSGIRSGTCASVSGETAMRNRNGWQSDSSLGTGHRNTLETGGSALGHGHGHGQDTASVAPSIPARCVASSAGSILKST